MKMVGKKTITINTIILNNPSIQHTLNKLVINFSTNQSIMLKIMYALDSTRKCNVVSFIRKQPKRVHATLSLRKNRQQVLRSPYHAQETSPHGDQPESQGSSKLSDMPQVQVFFLMKNYNYLLTKFILFSCKYEV